MMYLTIDVGSYTPHVIEFSDEAAARRAYNVIQTSMSCFVPGTWDHVANIELEEGGVASLRREYLRGVTLVKSRIGR